MKVGELHDGIEYDLAIRTTNGALYLVHTQMIQCIDAQGNPNGGYGVSMKTAEDMLRKHGKLTVARDFDGAETRTIQRGQISEIYSIQTRQNGPIVTVSKPKKSMLGKLAERVSHFFP